VRRHRIECGLCADSCTCRRLAWLTSTTEWS
jgi:hypothetical protein